MPSQRVEHPLDPDVYVIVRAVAFVERSNARLDVAPEPLRRELNVGEPIRPQTVGVRRHQPSTKFSCRPGHELDLATALRRLRFPLPNVVVPSTPGPLTDLFSMQAPSTGEIAGNGDHVADEGVMQAQRSRYRLVDGRPVNLVGLRVELRLVASLASVEMVQALDTSIAAAALNPPERARRQFTPCELADQLLECAALPVRDVSPNPGKVDLVQHECVPAGKRTAMALIGRVSRAR